MVPVLEAVPNVSDGRDPVLLERLVRAAREAGADVLDSTSDPDHNRSVLTLAGSPPRVERAALAVARICVESIDLRAHRGVHPRVGALDVLPFVPLQGLSMEDAARSARRVGRLLAEEVGIPVAFYGAASAPPGRALAGIRKGGFEAVVAGFPTGSEPDLLPPGWTAPGAHPSAGMTCVGAREVLLAWNLDVEGMSAADLRDLAARHRQSGGGIPGLRALALHLPGRDRLQLSMNLEDAARRDPFAVFMELEGRIGEQGGEIVGTEIIGLVPDALVDAAAADRLRLVGGRARSLSAALTDHVAARAQNGIGRVVAAVSAAGEAVPAEVRSAVREVSEDLLNVPGADAAK